MASRGRTRQHAHRIGLQTSCKRLGTLHEDKYTLSDFGILISMCKSIIHSNANYRIGLTNKGRSEW